MEPSQSLPLSSGIILNDRYKVGECINSGNQGFIFDIKDLKPELAKYLIPKVVKVSSFSPDTEKKFSTEAEKLSQFNHPGLPKIESKDAYFRYRDKKNIALFCCLVMEKIDGDSLDRWVEKNNNCPIDEKRAIAWLKQLLDILNIIHSKNFWHRDIKPQNIMRRSDDQLVLVDFSIGREQTETFEEKWERGSGTRAGTIGYEAPEQLEGKG